MLPALALLFAIPAQLEAQELKIGDKVPDITLTAMENDTPFTLYSINKKLVIVQFWNTLCKGCIRSFPKADSLQKKYKENVEFIYVSKESRQQIDEFFRLRRKIRKPAVKFITGDTVLNRYFPHLFVPHHVWLKDGKTVIAITAGQNTSDRTIAAFLSENKTVLATVKKQVHYDKRKPAVTLNIDSNWKAYAGFSYLMPPVDSAYFFLSNTRESGSVAHNRFVTNKATMLRLLLSAFDEGGKKQFERGANNLDVYLVKNKILLQPEERSLYDTWSQHHTFFYDVMVPPARANELYSFMQQDLQRIFNVSARIEQRLVNCMCIKLGDSSKLPYTAGGPIKGGGIDFKNDSLLHFRNTTLTTLVWKLEFHARFTDFHLKDHSGVTSKLDLDVPLSLTDHFDYTLLDKQLRKYGLFLEKKRCESEVLVIRDR